MSEGRLRKADWIVADITLKEAQAFIRAHHYARGGSNTRTYTHGLLNRATGVLSGVVWWIPPTRAACESVNRAEWKKVLSLSRMAVLPGVPKNACTFLLGRSVRIIAQERRFVSLVTYADDSQGHSGHVYTAAGWVYAGRTMPEARWVSLDGRQVARKAGGRTRTKQDMLDLGYVCQGSFRKHKFVRHLHADGKDLA